MDLSRVCSETQVNNNNYLQRKSDRLLVHFSIITEGRHASETLREHEQSVQDVLTAVRFLGIADRQIELNYVGLHTRGRNSDQYTATRSITVTVDDLRLVPSLVETIVGQGADRLQGVSYTLQDPTRYENEALRMAIERAREQAVIAAEAAGASLGSVLAIEERGVQRPDYQLRPSFFERAGFATDDTPGAYSAGSSEVRASVTVTFELVE